MMTLVPSYQKGKDCLFLLKGEWSLLIRRLSINVTLKSLLLVARIEKSSKSGVWLQNKRCSLMVESSSPWIIFSAIGTPTYKLAKFLLKILTPAAVNEFTVTDSFHFAEEICHQDSNLHMASLENDSLFTNISLEETINICLENLYNNNENPLTFQSMIFVICLT